MKKAEPIVKNVASFTVSGYSVRTQNSFEFDEKMAKLPKLWQKFSSNNTAIDKTYFGVYSDYESDAHGFYTFTAGVASENKITSKEFSSVTIHSGKYLVFEGKGDMPKVIVDTWKSIWDYFTADSQYKRCFMTDFESYNNSNEVAVYIGIE